MRIEVPCICNNKEYHTQKCKNYKYFMKSNKNNLLIKFHKRQHHLISISFCKICGFLFFKGKRKNKNARLPAGVRQSNSVTCGDKECSLRNNRLSNLKFKKQTVYKIRFTRICRRCTNKFTPTGRHSRICLMCHKTPWYESTREQLSKNRKI